MNQAAITFNNKGVVFLKYGHNEEALDMFLGSMQLVSDRIRSGGGDKEDILSRNSCSPNNNSKHIRNAITLQDQPINKILENHTRTDINKTEDNKSTFMNQYMYSKALSLPPIPDIVDEHVEVVYSAVLMYNAALTHHLRIHDKKNGSSDRPPSSSSMKKAIKLYEMACNAMCGIDITSTCNDELTRQLILATLTNMINLYDERGNVHMACTYRNCLSKFVIAQWYYTVTNNDRNVSQQESASLDNNRDDDDYNDEGTTRTKSKEEEIEDLMANAILLLNCCPQNCAAASA